MYDADFMIVYDNLVPGDNTHVFTSLRTPKVGDSDGKGVDYESLALQGLVQKRLCSHNPNLDVGTALGNSVRPAEASSITT